MINQLLMYMIQPRYFWGTLYLAVVGSSGGNIILDAIYCGIFFSIVDLIKESRMR